MTLDAATTAAMAAPPADQPEEASSRSSRSFGRQVFVDTFSRVGARVGLAWIIILFLAAVFAPFIASSFPLLVKEKGHWSSPVLDSLTSADVTLLAASFTTFILLATRKLSPLNSLACILWVVAWTLPLTMLKPISQIVPPTPSRVLSISLAVLFCVIDAAILILIPLFSGAPARAKRIIFAIALAVAILLIVFPVHPPQAIVYETYREKAAAGQLQAVVNTPIPYSANDYMRDHPEERLQAPSREHWMGTEQSGADVFSRMLHASRIALSIGFISTGIAVVIGVLVGGLMGYFSGTVDILGMRLIEILEAVPTLILLLTVCAFFGRNLYLMMAIIGLFSWTGNARFIRAEFFRLRQQDFVQAAIAAGLPLRSVIFRHMLPNGITAVLVNTSFGVASAILIESTLSFLGLGLVDEPSWGQLLNQARAGGTGFQWWLAMFPGLAIFLTVFAYNLIGEAVRDAIDPKLRKRD